MSVDISASISGDRFIPARNSVNMSISQYNLAKENDSSSLQTGLQRQMSESLFATSSVEECRILAMKAKAPEPRVGYENRLGVLYSQSLGATQPRRATRYIPSAPERTLEAPDMLDDYYLNLMDWSKDNRLAVALGSAVYVWSAETGDIVQLFDRPGVNVTSLNWAPGGQWLAIGSEEFEVQLWDVNRSKQVRKMSGHNGRVSSLSWNGSMVSSAGRDSIILNHDVRLQQHVVSSYDGHKQEVCGLQWSPDGTALASGGNDNLMFIWDQAAGTARHAIADHGAAVKALAWCPFAQDVLASGSGTADPSIRFWNASTGACLNTINTGAQVCALQWSRHYKEIVSTHGWTNNVSVWKYPSMVKSADLAGHTARPLHMTQSPDGTTIATASADCTIRFWKIWSPSEVTTAKAAPKAVSSRPAILAR
jgi:cell division cycle protein 20 (cofactor of APC complex)